MILNLDLFNKIGEWVAKYWLKLTLWFIMILYPSFINQIAVVPFLIAINTLISLHFIIFRTDVGLLWVSLRNFV